MTFTLVFLYISNGNQVTKLYNDLWNVSPVTHSEFTTAMNILRLLLYYQSSKFIYFARKLFLRIYISFLFLIATIILLELKMIDFHEACNYL